MSTYSAEYYQLNKERITKQHKTWREANQDLIKAIQHSWRSANEGRTYLEKQSGYVLHIGYQHPVANPSGITPHHRIVLWDAMSGQDAFCHWGCGTWVTWSKKHPYAKDALCVDHVNLDKSDNRIENLVPSCARCNVSRPGGRKETVRTKNLGQCSYETCTRNAKAAELCSAHYQQQYTGQELRPIGNHAGPMTQDQVDELVQRVSNGETLKSIGYAMGYDFSSLSRAYKRATGKSVKQFKAGAE